MSYQVKSKSQITNKDAAVSALAKKGWSYAVNGDLIEITQPNCPMSQASINLRTGTIEGDSDFSGMDGEGLGALNQDYQVAHVTAQISERGGYIEGTEVLEDGTIEMEVSF